MSVKKDQVEQLSLFEDDAPQESELELDTCADKDEGSIEVCESEKERLYRLALSVTMDMEHLSNQMTYVIRKLLSYSEQTYTNKEKEYFLRDMLELVATSRTKIDNLDWLV